MNNEDVEEFIGSMKLGFEAGITMKKDLAEKLADADAVLFRAYLKEGFSRSEAIQIMTSQNKKS